LGNSYSVTNHQSLTADGTRFTSFFVTATDPAGNIREWNFSARADAERWGAAWDNQDVDLLWPYIQRMAGVDSDPVMAPTTQFTTVGAVSLQTRSLLNDYMWLLRDLYGSAFGRNIDESSDGSFLDALLGSFNIDIILAAIGLTKPPAVNKVAINIAFEDGVTDKFQAAFQLANMQRLLDSHANAASLNRTEIDPHWIRGSVRKPEDGKWKEGDSKYDVVRQIKGPGFATFVFTKSQVVDAAGVSQAGVSLWGTQGKASVGGFIGPSPNPFTFAHELGHVIGWETPSGDKHAGPGYGNHVMTSPSPTLGAHIDRLYLDLLLRASRSR